jgi:hypothetical protein
MATPAGFEGSQGRVKTSETAPTPPNDDAGHEASHGFGAQSGHNLGTVRRLLHVLESAVRAHDVHRGLQLIEELRGLLAPVGAVKAKRHR